MTRIHLREYESAEVALPPEVAEALQAVAGSAVTVAPLFAAGRYRITATSWVGSVAAGTYEVRIRPKVPVDNVLFLLTSAWHRPWLHAEPVGYEQSELTGAFAALFANAVTQLLRRGAQHDYVEVTEDLETIRGRVDLTAQFRRCGLLTPVTCRFSEFTTDTPANRYLKHAVRLLLRCPGVWPATRRQLRHTLVGLVDVRADPPRLDLPFRLRYTRLNRAYETVLRLAYLVRSRVGLGDGRGPVSASSFLLDMNQVFERFIEERLRTALAGRLLVDGQSGDHLDVDRRVPIRPDLIFRDARGRVAYVGDAKYKLTGDGIGRAPDYFQLHAYCTRFRLAEGVLVYGTDDDDDAPPPRAVATIGDAIVLRAVRLPLMGSTSDLDAAVRHLAEDLHDRALARPMSDDKLWADVDALPSEVPRAARM